MSIFNSLGSNYNLSFAIKTLFSVSSFNLEKKLEERYGGKTTLVFKGREAITQGLKRINLPKNSQVAINGFTCYAVYKAIEEAGHAPILIDLPKNNLNFDADNLAQKVIMNPDIKAVVVQNTLGFPSEIEKIQKLCKEKRILLIEDLAHSAGTFYKNGREAGTVGDMTILSFSQDKIIDGVSGGALVERLKKKGNKRERTIRQDSPGLTRQIKDRFYPLLTLIIRTTYDLGFGKILHSVLKKLGILSTPMDGAFYKMLGLPQSYQNLALYSFERLVQNITHRQMISKIYVKNIKSALQSEEIKKEIEYSSCLRFPIFTYNRGKLIDYLKTRGFYLSDIWYDAPIAPKKFMKKIKYKNDCPNSEKISNTIINLPTHINISKEKALYLSKLINKWIEQAN